MASTIGIKIANGKFYPIMEENSTIKKRLILTTVHDNQPSVQIDLYRSAANAMTDAQYIGSLVVEKIKPKPKGEPSIEMVISSSSNGNIIADAIDLDTGAGGEHYVLTVSLKSLDETSRDIDLPDFELESNEEPPSALYKHSEKKKKGKKSSPKMWPFVLIGLIIILGIAAVWLFLFGGLEYVSSYIKPKVTESSWYKPEPRVQEPERQPEPVKEPEPVKQPEPVQPKVEPTPVIQAPPAPTAPKQQTSRKRPPAPVASYKVPATIPKEGVDYRIRWGDTLWDISGAFYRDPWLYPRIAKHNNIRNPDYIISGRTIRVPPKN
ncbi:MAG: Hsp70 family protein [Treponema sp.]|jgi:outer membrane biosynthesis protein TonB|nr:Hsp70 family protein [Treponema sp.]